MKTITYNPETHKLVPIEPTEEMRCAAQDAGLFKQYSSKIYSAMLNAAPPAEEAPGQEPDWSKSETLQTELWKSRFYSLAERLVMADGAVAFERKVVENLRSQLKQQPATHGEPVGYLDETGEPRLLPKPRAWIDRDKECEQALRDAKEYFADSLLYTSPQPTPEHIKAMWFALNILEQSRLTTSNKIIRNLCQQAITSLQNALMSVTDGKGTT